uniref:Uncharacterized protein n=2 Tax=Picea TaxID=3328 RepID=A0A101M4R7_PICGL|nr:hypothetical protein ABT39_MTgene713 [Picea glauca]QHR90208.1 hypothetical protein Q903MT_gene4231 [Picea sitchensis]
MHKVLNEQSTLGEVVARLALPFTLEHLQDMTGLSMDGDEVQTAFQ